MLYPSVGVHPRPAPPDAPVRPHLDFLDGIRALAALYVILGHAFLGTFQGPRIPYSFLTNWLIYVHFAVDVFIVLSGFCLALPVARHGTLRGGALDFFRRRARRILPPFYAAAALSLLLWIVSGMIGAIHHQSKLHPDAALAGVLLANVFLLQDLFPDANWVNTPFWSVAVEWKIYFLFPLLVWIWRRHGLAPMLAAAACIGYGLMALLHVVRPLLDQEHACPWYVFLFALGIWAAQAAASPVEAREERRWLWAAGGLLAALLLLLFGPAYCAGAFGWHVRGTDLPVLDTAAGALAAVVLVTLGRGGPAGATQAGLKALSWRPLTFLGTFAYSLYLLHVPLLLGVQTLLFSHGSHFASPLAGLPRLAKFAWLTAVGVPIVVAASYLFFLAFERPFLNTRRAEAHAAP